MSATLTVLSGPLAGTRVEIEDSAEEILVGSDPDCRLALDVPGVSPIHARLTIDASGLIAHDTRSAQGLYVNDTRVDGQAPVRDGDVLWLGTPGDETSVMIQCRVTGQAVEASPAVAPSAIDDDFVLAEAAPPPAKAADAIGDGLDALFAAAAVEPTPDVFFMEEDPPPAPVAAAPTTPSAADDLFFVEEPPPAPSVVAPAPPPSPARPAPASPPAAAALRPPTSEPAAPAPVAVRPPAPPPTPARPSASSPAAAPAKAATAPAAPRPIRRHMQSMPSAAIESEEEVEAPRPRSALPPRVAASPAPRRAARPPMGLIAGGAGLALAIAVAAMFLLRAGHTPAIESITPPRVGLGQSVTITGAHFGATPQANAVQFGGKAGRVVQASETRLQVEIPEITAAAGHDTPVPVVVVVDGHESKPATVGVFEAPRIHGIAPTVAMPGDEVVLAGAGWGAAAKVLFGTMAATVLDSTPTSLKVTVPATDAAPGTELPVRVTMGSDTSNPAPFVLGRLPLLVSVTPASAGPGDLVTLAGRGFDVKAASNDVRIGGARALVTSSSGGELKVVVPRTAAGESAIEIRVPGVANVGRAKLVVAALPDLVGLQFVAEPFEDSPGHDHAQLATGLGPAFVLSGAEGRPAAPRAFEAQRRLNDAATAIKASIDADIRARGLDGGPMLVLAGKDTPLVEITLDDAAGYEEDWTGLKGRGGPVTPARIAVWWEAVARDLVLLLVRGEKPHFAADLAPEGRAFADLSALARKSVTAGVPRQMIAEARPPVREALRIAALRIPPSVKGPAAPVAPGTVTAEPAMAALKLDGQWSGSETESGNSKFITVHFAGAAGSLTVERALSITTPLTAVAVQKGLVRFSMQTGAGPRYYQARWDGQKLEGTISPDPAGRTVVATFELTPG